MTTTAHKTAKHESEDEDEHKGSKTPVAMAAETPQPLAADTTTTIAVRMTSNIARMIGTSPSGIVSLQSSLTTDMKALRTLGGF
jgi:hypothetical protein